MSPTDKNGALRPAPTLEQKPNLQSDCKTGAGPARQAPYFCAPARLSGHAAPKVSLPSDISSDLF
jgi:hypothetical protein